MGQAIRIAILTEAPGSAGRLAAALAGDDRFDIVRASGGDAAPIGSLLACDVVVLSKAMPSETILGILGAFWEAARPPKLLFLETPPGAGSGDLDPEMARQLGRRIRRLAAATRRSVSTASYRTAPVPEEAKAAAPPAEQTGLPERSVLVRPPR